MSAAGRLGHPGAAVRNDVAARGGRAPRRAEGVGAVSLAANSVHQRLVVSVAPLAHRVQAAGAVVFRKARAAGMVRRLPREALLVEPLGGRECLALPRPVRETLLLAERYQLAVIHRTLSTKVSP